MNHKKVASPALFLLLIAAVFISFGAIPGRAAADTIGAQTVELLPPGQNTCTPVTPTDFTPYVFDGSLDSFEFTVPDASYVALFGTAGNTTIPFQYMTRHVNASGALRVHVDIASTPVSGTLPIKVTMLSSKGGGQPTCALLVSASVGSGPIQSQQQPTGAQSATGAGAPSSISQKPAGRSERAESAAKERNEYASGARASATSGAASSTEKGASSSIAASARDALSGLCASATGAYRLWLGLLIIYAILVGAALWAQFPASSPWMRTPESVAVAILVLLLLILGFWYLAVGCRSEFWMPLVAVLIAILGVLAAFRNHPRLTQLLLLQDETKV